MLGGTDHLQGYISSLEVYIIPIFIDYPYSYELSTSYLLIFLDILSLNGR